MDTLQELYAATNIVKLCFKTRSPHAKAVGAATLINSSLICFSVLISNSLIKMLNKNVTVLRRYNVVQALIADNLNYIPR